MNGETSKFLLARASLCHRACLAVQRWLIRRQTGCFTWAFRIAFGAVFLSWILWTRPLSTPKIDNEGSPRSVNVAAIDDEECAELPKFMGQWKSPSQIAEDIQVLGIDERPDAHSPPKRVLDVSGHVLRIDQDAQLKLRYDSRCRWVPCEKSQIPDACLVVKVSAGSVKNVSLIAKADSKSVLLQRKATLPPPRDALVAWSESGPRWIAFDRGDDVAKNGACIRFDPKGVAPYTHRLRFGDCLIWRASRWSKCTLGASSREVPIMRLERVQGDGLVVRLWASAGTRAQNAHLPRTVDRLDRKCLRQLHLIGARTAQQAIVDLSGTRALLKVGDHLVFAKNRWCRCSPLASAAKGAQRFTLTELFCLHGQWRIAGMLRSSADTECARVEIGQRLPKMANPRGDARTRPQRGLPRARTRNGTPAKENAARSR